jgi:hypothetical protein
MTEHTIEITPDTIDRVIREWQAENPGKDISELPSAEFADRMMKALAVTAHEGGDAVK